MIEKILGNYLASRGDNYYSFRVALFNKDFSRKISESLDLKNDHGSFIVDSLQPIQNILKDHWIYGCEQAGCNSTLFDSILIYCLSCHKFNCHKHAGIILENFTIRAIKEKSEMHIFKQSLPPMYSNMIFNGLCDTCLKDEIKILSLSETNPIYDQVEIEVMNFDRDIMLNKIQSFLNFRNINGRRMNYQDFKDYFQDFYSLNIPNLMHSIGISAEPDFLDALNISTFYKKYNPYLCNLICLSIQLSSASSETELNELNEKALKAKAGITNLIDEQLHKTHFMPDPFLIYSLLLAKLLIKEKLPFNYKILARSILEMLKIEEPEMQEGNQEKISIPMFNGNGAYRALMSRIFFPKSFLINKNYIPFNTPYSRTSWQHLYDDYDAEFFQQLCSNFEQYIIALNELDLDSIDISAIEHIVPFSITKQNVDSAIIPGILDLASHIHESNDSYIPDEMVIESSDKNSSKFIQELLFFYHDIDRVDGNKITLKNTAPTALIEFFDSFKQKYVWEIEEGHDILLSKTPSLSFSAIFSQKSNSCFLNRTLESPESIFMEFSKIFPLLPLPKKEILDSILVKIFLGGLLGKIVDGPEIIELDEKKQNASLLFYYEYLQFSTFFNDLAAFTILQGNVIDKETITSFLANLSNETQRSLSLLQKTMGSPIIPLSKAKLLNLNYPESTIKSNIMKWQEENLLDYKDHLFAFLSLFMMKQFFLTQVSLIEKYRAWF